MTTYFRFLPAIAMALLLLLGGCSDDDTLEFSDEGSSEEQSVIVYRDETRFIDDDTNGMLESLSETQVVFSGSTELLESINAGDIMVSTQGNKFQDHGYLYRVIDKTESGGQTTFNVEQAYVTDYIVYADIYMSWAFEEGPGKNDLESCVSNFEVKLEKNLLAEDEAPFEGCTPTMLEEELLLNAQFSSKEFCRIVNFETHIRPEEDIYTECMEDYFANNSNDGFLSWSGFKAGLQVGNCGAQDLTSSNFGSNSIFSRVEGVSMTFEMTAPESKLAVNLEAQISLYFPIRELIPKALKKKMAKVLEFVDIDIAAGLFTGGELNGKVEVSQDFSLDGIFTVSKGEGVPKSKLEAPIERLGDPVISVEGSVKYDLVKFETGIKIFGRGGCASLAAYAEMRVAPTDVYCVSLEVGFEGKAELDFELLGKGVKLEEETRKWVDLLEHKDWDCALDLSGNWSATGFAECDGVSSPQNVSIEHDIDNRTIVATNISGGTCVPAESIAFAGEYDGYSPEFVVVFPNASSSGPPVPVTMRIKNHYKFEGAGVTFEREP